MKLLASRRLRPVRRRQYTGEQIFGVRGGNIHRGGIFYTARCFFLFSLLLLHPLFLLLCLQLNSVSIPYSLAYDKYLNPPHQKFLSHLFHLYLQGEMFQTSLLSVSSLTLI